MAVRAVPCPPVGSRANFVLVDDRGWRLFFAKSAAQDIDRLLAPGPGCARRFIEAQRECAPDEGWLDDRWCEGAALIDNTRRRLLFFTELYGVEQLRACVALVGRTWPGWTVEWAFGGLANLTSYLGLSTDDRHVSECDGQLVLPPVELARGLDAVEFQLRDIVQGAPRHVDVRPAEIELVRRALSDLRAEAA